MGWWKIHVARKANELCTTLISCKNFDVYNKNRQGKCGLKTIIESSCSLRVNDS